MNQMEIKYRTMLGKELYSDPIIYKEEINQKLSEKYWLNQKVEKDYSFGIYKFSERLLYEISKSNCRHKDLIKNELKRRLDLNNKLLNVFINLSDNRELANFLDENYSKLIRRLNLIDNKKHDSNYVDFYIPKKDGTNRKISVPTKNLLITQKKLNYLLQLVYKPSKAAHGFIKSQIQNESFIFKNIVTNAKQHRGRKIILNMDIEDFFPTITAKRIFGLFRSAPFNFNNKVAGLLAEICVHDVTKTLPQGAPTSPIISNMVCKVLDAKLIELSKKYHLVYTRYADDLTFSSSKQYLPEGILNEISNIVEGTGFSIKKQKTRVLTKSVRQEVTGLIINEKVNVSRKYIRNVRAMLHNWDVNGLEKCKEKFKETYFKTRKNKDIPFEKVVKGKIDFIGQVRGMSKEEDKYEMYINLIKKYYWLICEKDQYKYRNLLMKNGLDGLGLDKDMKHESVAMKESRNQNSTTAENYNLDDITKIL